MFRKLFATLLLTSVGAGVGIGGAEISPSQWQTQAQLEAPRVNELGNYFSLYSTYSLVSGDALAVNHTQLEKNLAELAYGEFKKKAQSRDELIAFLQTTENAKIAAELDRTSPQRIAEKMANQFQFSETANGDLLSFASFDAKESGQLFGDYLRHLNTKAREQINNEMISKWKALFQQVKSAADAKLDTTWENKLKMMTSVQPLDNQLISFRFASNPTTQMTAKPYHQWGAIGAAAGFLLGLIVVLIIGSPRTKIIQVEKPAIEKATEKATEKAMPEKTA